MNAAITLHRGVLHCITCGEAIHVAIIEYPQRLRCAKCGARYDAAPEEWAGEGPLRHYESASLVPDTAGAWTQDLSGGDVLRHVVVFFHSAPRPAHAVEMDLIDFCEVRIDVHHVSWRRFLLWHRLPVAKVARFDAGPTGALILQHRSGRRRELIPGGHRMICSAEWLREHLNAGLALAARRR